MQDDIAPAGTDGTGGRFLILTAAAADALAGPTGAGAALAPVALTDGVTFVLPLGVRTDLAHQAVAAALAALPEAWVDATRFPVLPGPNS